MVSKLQLYCGDKYHWGGMISQNYGYIWDTNAIEMRRVYYSYGYFTAMIIIMLGWYHRYRATFKEKMQLKWGCYHRVIFRLCRQMILRGNVYYSVIGTLRGQMWFNWNVLHCHLTDVHALVDVCITLCGEQCKWVWLVAGVRSRNLTATKNALTFHG